MADRHDSQNIIIFLGLLGHRVSLHALRLGFLSVYEALSFDLLSSGVLFGGRYFISGKLILVLSWVFF